MKCSKYTFFLCLLLIGFATQAQVRLPKYADTLFSTYYWQRVTHFNDLPQTKDDIIFVGNSITDGAEWSELFNDLKIKNRGISGDVSAGVINRLDEITNRNPAKVFLMIGINDLTRNVSPDSLLKNFLLIADYIRQQSPSTQLYIQSLLPVNNVYGKFGSHTSKAGEVVKVNTRLSENASVHGYTFINLNAAFSDKAGKLNAGLTNDGLHLKGEAYLIWKHLVYPDVYGLNEKPALLPLPQNLQWKAGKFPLYACKNIVVQNKSLANEAQQLQQMLLAKGLQVNIVNKKTGDGPFIEMALDNINTPLIKKEAYRINVGDKKVTLTGNTTHGLFNALQTFHQLARDGAMIDQCDIIDWPAFSWRGYMIDVGRNYMSMDILKQQIDVLAAYKLNVFHFHPTEDIAWRLASKQYPQLTAPEHMLRNKGMYYSESNIKELIAYCKERHITFVPEIDMPGHSAAFKRAMKTDMQSDSGMVILKNILKEFFDTYDLKYIHIGADEVKITNKEFVPEMTKFLEGLGKKVIGWEPGGNFTNSTIRQLWMDDNGKIAREKNIQYVDSRHLYINHMDPLEGVVTVFNRKIGNKEKGDEDLLGGTICMWHDRAVAKEEDVLEMNPVYPVMLAFADRGWRGGGKSGWIANINEGDTASFKEFESRLLENKKLYFASKPFPYVKQSNLTWQLIGPFDNGGDVSKKFDPEQVPYTKLNISDNNTATGGTIVLKHWWAPLISGAVNKPAENTTWYAHTKIWSDDAGVKKFWIGFNNLSRSPATDGPPVNEWDNKGSEIWVNGKLVNPPVWNRGGQRGNSEIPLIDEGYEYRKATDILLNKGWNDVLVKAPIKAFKGRDWQNPVKWMFTFVPLTL
ncbi:MAG: family 20 glycosylhydrolase [Chitinophagaceae bacterium]